MICELEPHFAGAWLFQSWNMAYNLSFTVHTPEQRWLWVYNGLKLLRDRGIAMNPKSVNMYREMAWLFYFKMGGFSDDMHEAYKQRWASAMQQLLAPPSYGQNEAILQEFRDIVQAPLDKDPRFQGRDFIQAGPLATLLAEPPVGALSVQLLHNGVSIDRALLAAYNRWSLDASLQAIRQGPPRPQAPDEQALSALLNDPNNAASLRKALAFVRAQLLWNEYKMDPQWMLDLMNQYGPFDWRLVWPHSLYWATYGYHVIDGTPLASLVRFDSFNDTRIVIQSLQQLTWGGRLTYIENPEAPDEPTLRYFPDERYMEAVQQEYLRYIERWRKGSSVPVPFEANPYRTGHTNYLVQSVMLMYPLGHVEQCQTMLTYLRDGYKLTGEPWDMEVEDFIVHTIKNTTVMAQDEAMSQISPAISTACLRRLGGDEKGYLKSIDWAKRVHRLYQETHPPTAQLPPMPDIQANATAILLADPRSAGYYISLVDRSTVYRMTDLAFQRMIYNQIAPLLRRQCQDAGVDFIKAFPPPPGMAAPQAPPG